MRTAEEVAQLVATITERIDTADTDALCEELGITKDYYYNLCNRYKIVAAKKKTSPICATGLGWVHAEGKDFKPVR